MVFRAKNPENHARLFEGSQPGNSGVKVYRMNPFTEKAGVLFQELDDTIVEAVVVVIPESFIIRDGLADRS